MRLIVLSALAACLATTSAIAPPTSSIHAELIPALKNKCLKDCTDRYRWMGIQIKSIFCSATTGELIGQCVDKTCKTDTPWVFEEYGLICGHYPTPTASPTLSSSSVAPTPTPDPNTGATHPCLKKCIAYYMIKNKESLCLDEMGEQIGICIKNNCEAETPYVWADYGNICGHYPSPVPRSSTPSPTPSPTRPFAPFGSPCWNQCVNQDKYKDLVGFCKVAKGDESMYYCTAKLCNSWDRVVFNNSVDAVCQGLTSSSTLPPSSTTISPSSTSSSTPTATFHPFKMKCLNECVDVQNKYTDKKAFCKQAKDDSDLIFCAAKRCYVWQREEYNKKVDEVCAGGATSTSLSSSTSSSPTPTPTFHPFANKCLNECLEEHYKHWYNATCFCLEVQDNSNYGLYYCAAYKCFKNRDDFNALISGICAGSQSSSTTEPPESSTTPPPESLSTSKSRTRTGTRSHTVSEPFPCWNKTLCSHPHRPTTYDSTSSPTPTTKGMWDATLATTKTVIETLTVCPTSHTCTGQTVTWTHTFGPTSCPPTVTCTCVLPGGPNEPTELPTLETCPPSITCTGQTTTVAEEETITLAETTITGGQTVVLPSETVPNVLPTETGGGAGPAETSSVEEFPGRATKAGVGLMAALFGVIVAL